MINNGYDRAKELFIKYHGSYFHMVREGDFDEYKTYNISKKQEQLWKDELVKQLVDNLSMDDNLPFSDLSSIACDFGDYTILEEIIKYTLKHINDGDSFIRLLYAEAITRVIISFINHKRKCPKPLLISAKDVVINLLRNVLNSPIYVSSHWDLSPIIDVRDENYIRDRANRDLGEIERIKIK